jgi:hypothetical protein
MMSMTAYHDELRLSSFWVLGAAKAQVSKLSAAADMEGGFTMQAMFEG